MIEIHAVSVHARTKTILDEVSLALRPGELTALVGPNGAGKSTLFDTLAGLRQPSSGHVSLAGRPLAAYSATALARLRAVMPQRVAMSFPLRVVEVVMLGRLPFGSHETDDDVRAAESALARMEALDLVDRTYATLSGGEQQRVQIARALAQIAGGAARESRTLLLDEPCASLDLAHARTLYRVLRDEARRGTAVLIVDHDLARATAADRLVVMAGGRIVGDGPPSVLDATLMRAAFGVDAELVRLPSGAVALDMR